MEAVTAFMWHLLLFVLVTSALVIVGIIITAIVFGLAHILREDNEDV